MEVQMSNVPARSVDLPARKDKRSRDEAEDLFASLDEATTFVEFAETLLTSYRGLYGEYKFILPNGGVKEHLRTIQCHMHTLSPHHRDPNDVDREESRDTLCHRMFIFGVCKFLQDAGSSHNLKAAKDVLTYLSPQEVVSTRLMTIIFAELCRYYTIQVGVAEIIFQTFECENFLAKGNLLHSIERTNLPLIRLLLQSGAKIEEEHWMAAVDQPKPFILSALLASSDSWKAHQDAMIKQANLISAIVLLNNGVRPSGDLLDYFVEKGDVEKVRLLLTRGAGRDIDDPAAEQRIRVAIRKDQPEILRVLLTHLSPHKNYDRLLVTACEVDDNAVCVQILFEHGIGFSCIQEALEEARDKNFSNVIDVLSHFCEV